MQIKLKQRQNCLRKYKPLEDKFDKIFFSYMVTNCPFLVGTCCAFFGNGDNRRHEFTTAFTLEAALLAYGSRIGVPSFFLVKRDITSERLAEASDANPCIVC